MASVFLYIPNIIGYIRLFLILSCWVFFDNIYLTLPLYTLQMFLDGIDGYLARRLSQCSAFGSWLDVLVDNIGRTVLWTRLYKWGLFVSCIEWTVFVCTHNLGPDWKNTLVKTPQWVQQVMANGFYNPLGALVISGLHGLPLYLYAYYHKQAIPINTYILGLPLLILVPARLLCLLAELSYINIHIQQLILKDTSK